MESMRERQYRFDFSLALQLALSVHQRQLDKGGEPYIMHPIRVAMRLKAPILKVVALLHDVLEDGDQMRREMMDANIRAYFGGAVLHFVHELTRSEGEKYEPYIERVALSKVGRLVKLADLEDNLDPIRWERTGYKPSKDKRIHYEWARFYLNRLEIYEESNAQSLCKTSSTQGVDTKREDADTQAISTLSTGSKE